MSTEHPINIKANSDEFIFIQGRYIASIEQSGDLKIEIEGVGYGAFQTHIPIDHGRSFSRVRLINETGQPVTGKLKYSNSPITDRRPDGAQTVEGSVSIDNWLPVWTVQGAVNVDNFPDFWTVNVDNFPEAFDVNILNATVQTSRSMGEVVAHSNKVVNVTQKIIISSQRMAVHITAEDGDIRLGAASISATAGFLLKQGGSLVLRDLAGDVYACAVGAGDVKVSIFFEM